MKEIQLQAQRAKDAARILSVTGTKERNEGLIAIAEAIRGNADRIIEANAIDIQNAKEADMREALIDRLKLDHDRIEAMAAGVLDVAALPDPVGKVENMTTRPNGLIIGRKKVPLGVIAFIYESRPNVTVDGGVLCLKSGNAVLLRGGKEAYNSNRILADIMREALGKSGLPQDCVCLINDTSRDSVNDLLNLKGFVDLLIPRGGAGLINHVTENAKIPVVQTGVGNCHTYVEKTADLQMAEDIAFNAKCSRPSVCNAMETLLVDREIGEEFLPAVKKRLDTMNTELRGCETAFEILPGIKKATEEDYATEYSDYILAVKVVSGIDEAIEHITKFGTGHSEAIVTENYTLSQRFLNEIDASSVYVNASTRFTDGGEFGLGAEIGISTQKMHARGPMGLEQLTSYKFIVYGQGQIR